MVAHALPMQVNLNANVQLKCSMARVKPVVQLRWEATYDNITAHETVVSKNADQTFSLQAHHTYNVTKRIAAQSFCCITTATYFKQQQRCLEIEVLCECYIWILMYFVLHTIQQIELHVAKRFGCK